MVECPVCLRDVKLDPNVREGDIIQCPYCKVWLKITLENGEWVAERVQR
jgi:Zn-finger nucleic acid-binding protein